MESLLGSYLWFLFLYNTMFGFLNSIGQLSFSPKRRKSGNGGRSVCSRPVEGGGASLRCVILNFRRWVKYCEFILRNINTSRTFTFLFNLAFYYDMYINTVLNFHVLFVCLFIGFSIGHKCWQCKHCFNDDVIKVSQHTISLYGNKSKSSWDDNVKIGWVKKCTRMWRMLSQSVPPK